MGEVYRAKDTRLDRDVALKILPETFASDADRGMRFAREAKTLAALNHPHIAQVYDTGRDGSRAFIAMELVEGADLSQRIARGAIPMAEALPMARQIADALATAHDAGIIHRDLKPANIKITDDGVVKVLDFGLAKALAPEDASATADGAATMTSPAMTAMGLILGTASYMAPEQAKGRPVDRRADVWAFGVVLYEMLTGRVLFGREDLTDTLAAVLTHEPDLSKLPSGTPAPIRRLIARCLVKDKKARLDSMAVARFEIDDAIAGKSDPAGAAQPMSRRSPVIAIAAVLVIAIAVAALAWYLKPVPAVPLRRIELPPAMAAHLSEQRLRNRDVHPALSPDGASIAYADGGHLWVRGLDAVESRDLGALSPFVHALAWSPDSRTVAFAAEQTLRTIPIAGGAPFVVCRIPGSGELMGIAWQPDGRIAMAVWRDSLYVVPAAGGEPVVRLAADPAKEVDFHDLAVAPGGGLIVSTHLAARSDIRTELLRGSERIVLWDGAGVSRVTYAAPGLALFQRNAPNIGVWASPWNDQRLDVAAAVPVAAGAVAFSASDDGALLYGLPVPQTYRLAWVDRQGAVVVLPGSAEAIIGQASLSPDGQRALFAARRGDNTNIFVREVASGRDIQLTFNTGGADFRANPSNVSAGAAARSPSWFPSGDRVLYAVGGAGTTQIVSQRADTAEPPKPLLSGTAGYVARNGRTVLMLVSDRGIARLRRSDIGPDGSIGPPGPAFGAGKDPGMSDFILSADSRLLAYVPADAPNQLNLFVTGFPETSWEVRVDEDGHSPRFSLDGRELFYVKGSTDARGQRVESLVSVSIGGTPVKAGSPVTLYTVRPGGPTLESFDVAPDGRRFLVRVPAGLGGGDGARLIYVQNWRAGLKK